MGDLLSGCCTLLLFAASPHTHFGACIVLRVHLVCSSPAAWHCRFDRSRPSCPLSADAAV